MIRLITAFGMCLGMFTALPLPKLPWREDARPWMPLFLPATGLLLGVFWAIPAWLFPYLNLPLTVQGIVLCALPFLLTGFLHLDGFMDVSDAIGSWQDRETRLKILKDSHVGAMAVASCGLLLLAQFAFFAAGGVDGRFLLLLPAVSRCGSAMAVTVLPPLSVSQYHQEKRPRCIPWITLLTALLLTAAGFLLSLPCGIGLAGALLGYGLSLWQAVRALGGVSGDVAGYALTLSELSGIVCYTLANCLMPG